MRSPRRAIAASVAEEEQTSSWVRYRRGVASWQARYPRRRWLHRPEFASCDLGHTWLERCSVSVEKRRYSIPAYTEGWFQIGWSDKLARGELQQLRHFGQTYVLFRGENGEVGVIDDICPHLGAHISEGGCVKGNSVRCPYHHWAFNGQGMCTDIPYAKTIPKKARTNALFAVPGLKMEVLILL